MTLKGNYYCLYSLNNRGNQIIESRGGGQNDDLLHDRPVETVRDNFLSDLEPYAWKLCSKDLKTIYNDYYYDKFEACNEVAAAQAKLNPNEIFFRSIMMDGNTKLVAVPTAPTGLTFTDNYRVSSGTK